MSGQQTLKRRGLIAGAAALVAGIAAKQAIQPVAAVNGGTNGTALIIGARVGTANTETESTWLTNGTVPIGSYTSADTFLAASQYGTGVVGWAFGYGEGVYGVNVGSPGGAGVRGDSTNANGVEGHAGSGYGVFGTSSDAAGVGVYGTNTNDFGDAIRGVSSLVDGTGVRGSGYYGVTGGGTQYGVYGSTGGGLSAIGVWGFAGAGTGVQGTSTSSNGVYGRSSTGYGVLGYSTGGSASLSGISTNANIPAFAGGNSVAGGLAAAFSGTVFVNGMFVVADMTQKHGLLKHPDGSHRLMYTVEAPESWAEDFGTGTLVNGKADVKLDPDFAALIHTDEYHVFLTEHGGHHGLHTTAKGATGFTVEADHDLATAKGKSAVQLTGTFSWRIVARPKTDHKSERLGKFAVPNIPLPDVSKFNAPEVPAVPKKP